MNNRKRILVTTFVILAGGVCCAAAIAITVLYRTSFEEERGHLVELARSQARFMEAVARFDAIHSQDSHPDGARAATLSQIAAAHEHYSGFCRTGELVIARREGDQIVFLYPYRHGDGGDPDPLPWASTLAEPMRLALSGQEGTLVGIDYRGEPVLAAHEPVAVLNLGVVAKMDLAELRAPFVRAGMITSGVTVLLALVGVGLTLGVTGPILRRLRDSEEIFRAITQSAHDAIVMMDAEGRVSRWNEAAERMFGFAREDVIGKPLHATIVPKQYRGLFSKAQPHFRETGDGPAIGRTLSLTGLRKSGEEFPVELSLSSAKIRGGWHAIAVMRDATERERAEDELRKLSVAVAQSPVTVVITDTEGTIEYVNPRFTETTGYTAEEAVGQNPRILKSGDTPSDTYKQMWETLFAGEVWRGEFHNKRKDGTSYWEAASISPIRNSEGAITHFLAVKEDITERKRAVEELQRTRAAAEATDRAKSEFLASMSHEIRTPMNAIIGYADLLWRVGDLSQAPQQRKEAVLAIRGSGRHLLDLINDILDLSRIESGNVQMEIADCDPWRIVADVVSTLNVRAAKQKIELAAEITEAIPQTIRTDSGRLRQCLMNLVGNAVKFDSSVETPFSVK